MLILWPSLSYNLSLSPSFCLILSGCFKQVLLYFGKQWGQHFCLEKHDISDKSTFKKMTHSPLIYKMDNSILTVSICMGWSIRMKRVGSQWLSGRVLDTRLRGPWVWASPASLRCGPWARHIYPSLLLVQPRKTRPCLTERLLMGRKESNQTMKRVKLTHIKASFTFFNCVIYVQGHKWISWWFSYTL